MGMSARPSEPTGPGRRRGCRPRPGRRPGRSCGRSRTGPRRSRVPPARTRAATPLTAPSMTLASNTEASHCGQGPAGMGDDLLVELVDEPRPLEDPGLDRRLGDPVAAVDGGGDQRRRPGAAATAVRARPTLVPPAEVTWCRLWPNTGSSQCSSTSQPVKGRLSRPPRAASTASTIRGMVMIRGDSWGLKSPWAPWAAAPGRPPPARARARRGPRPRSRAGPPSSTARRRRRRGRPGGSCSRR